MYITLSVNHMIVWEGLSSKVSWFDVMQSTKRATLTKSTSGQIRTLLPTHVMDKMTPKLPDYHWWEMRRMNEMMAMDGLHMLGYTRTDGDNPLDEDGSQITEDGDRRRVETKWAEGERVRDDQQSGKAKWEGERVKLGHPVSGVKWMCELLLLLPVLPLQFFLECRRKEARDAAPPPLLQYCFMSSYFELRSIEQQHLKIKNHLCAFNFYFSFPLGGKSDLLPHSPHLRPSYIIAVCCLLLLLPSSPSMPIAQKNVGPLLPSPQIHFHLWTQFRNLIFFLTHCCLLIFYFFFSCFIHTHSSSSCKRKRLIQSSIELQQAWGPTFNRLQQESRWKGKSFMRMRRERRAI